MVFLIAGLTMIGFADTLFKTRKAYAAKLKAAGNKAYGSKDYNRAIELYGKAILCKPDPVFYSNRAACYNVLSEWDKVIGIFGLNTVRVHCHYFLLCFYGRP